jgi:putative redox protein
MPTISPEHEPQKSSVRVSETGVESLQLVGRARRATFLAGGRRAGEDDFFDLSPYDLLAAALASCTAMTVRVFAERHGMPLERIEVEVSHSRLPGETHDLLRAVMFLHGPLDEAQRVKLLEVASLCPISRTLLRGMNVGSFLHVEGQADPQTGVRTDYLQDLGMITEDPQDPRFNSW